MSGGEETRASTCQTVGARGTPPPPRKQTHAGGGGLTGGDVGGGVGVGHAGHLAGDAGLAGPAVAAEVGETRGGGRRDLAVHENVRGKRVGCGGAGRKWEELRFAFACRHEEEITKVLKHDPETKSLLISSFFITSVKLLLAWSGKQNLRGSKGFRRQSINRKSASETSPIIPDCTRKSVCTKVHRKRK